MSDAAFGPVTTPLDVENAVIATLKAWMPTYLQYMGRRGHLTASAYPPVQSYRAADAMDERFIEQMIPAVQVQMTVENVVYSQPESAVGHFNGVVDVLVQGPTPETCRENAITYAFAVGLVLAQHRGLDGSISTEGLKWSTMGVPAIGKPDNRWLAVGSVGVELAVASMFNQERGPAAPTEAVPPDYPIITTEQLILEPEGVT